MGERRLDYLPLDDLQPNPDNPKTHDVAGIYTAMGRLGYIEPIAVDERTGYLISGHGRLETLQRARKAGEAAPDGVRTRKGKWLVPVERGWTSKDDREATAALIALNRWAEKGGWDSTELIAALEAISASEPGLDGVGFDDGDLDDLLARVQENETAFDGDDWDATYADRQVRSLILEFKLDDYRWVAETAARARPIFGVDSNAELFLALLDEHAKQGAA